MQLTDFPQADSKNQFSDAEHKDKTKKIKELQAPVFYNNLLAVHDKEKRDY